MNMYILIFSEVELPDKNSLSQFKILHLYINPDKYKNTYDMFDNWYDESLRCQNETHFDIVFLLS